MPAKTKFRSPWSVVPLAREVQFLSGGTPNMDTARYWGGDIPWVSSGEMTQRRISSTSQNVTEDGARDGSKLVPARTILAVVRGMSLAKEFRVAITQRSVTFNQDLKALVPSARLFPEFLFFYLLSQNAPIRDSASESAHGTKKLDTQVLEEWPLPLPPIPVQRKIAAVLAAYDDLIEANRRRIALLERMAEETYREWFVRLRFPGHAKTKITKGLPVGWRDGRFRDLCRLQRGYDLPDALIQDGPYPVIASTAIKAFHAEFKVEPPVITTGRSGSLGKVLLVNQRAWPLNTSLYVRDFHGNSPYLVFYTLRGMGLESFNSGAGVPTLNRNHLEGLRLAIPPPDLQTRFDECVGPIHRQGDILEKSNTALQRTRDLLLPRLISGKLSVEALDIAFPPSMAEK
jgi:type I restriction enzyme S subunit